MSRPEKENRRFFRPIPVFFSTCAVVCLAAGTARAQQIVAFDITYTASTTTTRGAHFDVKPRADQPANWVSPINYSAGTVYIHQEVMTKPSAQDTMVDICFDGDLEGYGCIGTDFYTTTGVHETVEKMSTMWQYNMVAWAKKRTLYQLVVKDRGNHNGGQPVTDFMPTTMRIVLTVVPPGGTYVPPAGSGVDGGATDGAAPDAGPTTDASVPPADAATGTGGVSGTGGQPGGSGGAPASSATGGGTGSTGSSGGSSGAAGTGGTGSGPAVSGGSSNGGCRIATASALDSDGVWLPGLASVLGMLLIRRRRRCV